MRIFLTFILAMLLGACSTQSKQLSQKHANKTSSLFPFFKSTSGEASKSYESKREIASSEQCPDISGTYQISRVQSLGHSNLDHNLVGMELRFESRQGNVLKVFAPDNKEYIVDGLERPIVLEAERFLAFCHNDFYFITEVSDPMLMSSTPTIIPHVSVYSFEDSFSAIKKMSTGEIIFYVFSSVIERETVGKEYHFSLGDSLKIKNSGVRPGPDDLKFTLYHSRRPSVAIITLSPMD